MTQDADPPPDPAERRRTWLAAALLALALAGIAAAVLLRDEEDGASRPEEPPAILAVEQDGLRWTYHLPSGTEALFDLEKDPRCLTNLAADRPEDADRLRREVERREGAPVEELRGFYREQIERLRSLGYL